jgi:hypothetical protein
MIMEEEPEPRKRIKAELTPEDWEAARVIGGAQLEVIARAINSALDRKGVPREGRSVTAVREHESYDSPGQINVQLPPGYDLDLDGINADDYGEAAIMEVRVEETDEDE